MERSKSLLRPRWALGLLFLLLLMEAHSRARAQQSAGVVTTTTGRPAVVTPRIDPTYFFMDGNGGYKYTFAGQNGYEGEQSANRENEVSGYYTYAEKGVPYMVRYKAGVQGYQPEVIPRGLSGQLLPFQTAAPHSSSPAAAASSSVLMHFTQIGDRLRASHLAHAAANTAAAASNVANFQSAAVAPTTPLFGVDNTAGGRPALEPTLKFVQDAMKTMQTHPLHVSFASHQTHLQQQQPLPQPHHQFPVLSHPPTPFAPAMNFHLQPAAFIQRSHHGIFQHAPQQQIIAPVVHPTPAPTRRSPTILLPVSNAEIHNINSLMAQQQPAKPATLTSHPTDADNQPKRPYTFSYLADQSARSEVADTRGNVMGKYSYYDEAGFHDLSYKAGDDIGFVILGGSLAKPKIALSPQQGSETAQLMVNVPQSLKPLTGKTSNTASAGTGGKSLINGGAVDNAVSTLLTSGKMKRHVGRHSE